MMGGAWAIVMFTHEFRNTHTGKRENKSGNRPRRVIFGVCSLLFLLDFLSSSNVFFILFFVPFRTLSLGRAAGDGSHGPD